MQILLPEPHQSALLASMNIPAGSRINVCQVVHRAVSMTVGVRSGPGVAPYDIDLVEFRRRAAALPEPLRHVLSQISDAVVVDCMRTLPDPIENPGPVRWIPAPDYYKTGEGIDLRTGQRFKIGGLLPDPGPGVPRHPCGCPISPRPR